MQYLTNLHRLQVEGVSGSSMFTWEHKNDTPRFPFFDAVMRRIPGFASVPVMWWYVVLKFFSVVAVSLGFYGLFRTCRVSHSVAHVFALITTFFYAPYAIQAPGLSSWFLALFLSGLVAFFFAAVRRPYSLVALLTSVSLLFLSGMHPVFLLTAVGMGGAWWPSGILLAP